MDKKPIILVTNDDGIEAQGIQFLTSVMEQFGEVYVVAPQQHQSGMSHAITIQVPLRLRKHTETENLHIYSVSGTPVDCVKFAMDRILPNHKADLIVSGINHGSNSANSAIYSGTVACVREGAINNIPSIAFSSLDYAPVVNFTPYKSYIEKIVKTVLQQGLEKHVFLNVNFPRPENPIKGMKVCKQADGMWVERFAENKDPLGRTYFWLTGGFENEEKENSETDEWCLDHNIISIVPLKVESTDFQAINALQSLNE
ncbi:MAG: 5'/3'-nucleotidase SurE [Bacteroidales bacterium]|nr:5'/3'-nucleotidase SurE [Bacteroidales bacterium]